MKKKIKDAVKGQIRGEARDHLPRKPWKFVTIQISARHRKKLDNDKLHLTQSWNKFLNLKQMPALGMYSLHKNLRKTKNFSSFTWHFDFCNVYTCGVSWKRALKFKMYNLCTCTIWIVTNFHGFRPLTSCFSSERDFSVFCLNFGTQWNIVRLLKILPRP